MLFRYVFYSCSCYTRFYPIYCKINVLTIFCKFQPLVEWFFNCKIRVFQSNWSGEFCSLSSFKSSRGISHHCSYPHTHQHNGAIELKHDHIVEIGLALLNHNHLPLCFRDNVLHIAYYVINCMLSPISYNQSPFQRLFHNDPNFSFIHVFGCACWPKLRPYTRHKLQPWTIRYFFLGYSLNPKGYKMSQPPNGKSNHFMGCHFLGISFSIPAQVILFLANTKSISISWEWTFFTTFPSHTWAPPFLLN